MTLAQSIRQLPWISWDSLQSVYLVNSKFGMKMTQKFSGQCTLLPFKWATNVLIQMKHRLKSVATTQVVWVDIFFKKLENVLFNKCKFLSVDEAHVTGSNKYLYLRT